MSIQKIGNSSDKVKRGSKTPCRMFDELKIGWRHFLRTKPLLCLRLRGYGMTALGAVIYWGIIFGVSGLVRNTLISVAFFGFGLVGSIAIYRFLKINIFSILDSNYVAVLTELVSGERVPFTRFQIRFARKKVTQKFGNRQRINDAYLRLHKSLNEILVASPFPQDMGAWLSGQPFFFRKMANRIHIRRTISLKWFVDLFLNLKYMDDLAISHCFIKKDDILWENLRESLILSAQNFKEILKISFHTSILTICFSFAFFIVLIPPLLGLSWFLPFFKYYFFLSAFFFTWAFKKIFLDSYAMATLVSEFRKIIEGQSPDPQWDKRLSAISGSFFEIKKRACYWEHAQREFVPSYQDSFSSSIN